MTVAIENFVQLNDKNKILFLGDMFELGNESDSEHQNIIDLAQKLNLKTFFIGKHFFNIS